MENKVKIERIKEMLPDYLEHHKRVNIKKPFKCFNPSHHDRNPSMSYDRYRNKCHCFSCGADYSLIDLIGIDYNLDSDKEMIEKAIELYGDTHNSIHTSVYTEQNKEEVYKLEDGFFDKAHESIGKTDYLHLRGISDRVINLFNIGYIEDWKHPKMKNYPPTARVIIPTGKNSYLARATGEEKNYQKLRFGNIEIFNKECLTRATKPIFIVEGEIDALSIIEAGGEAVALCSTTMVNKFIEYLKDNKPTEQLIIFLDNDKAGREARQKIRDGLNDLGIGYYEPTVTDKYKDPNEFLIKDREAFIKTVHKAIDKAREIEENGLQEEKERYFAELQAHKNIYNFIDGIQERANTPAISSGFLWLDSALDGGFYEGLYIVGAISSLGKTTLVLQIADQIAQSGQDVLIFSLEMARSELMSKSISRETLLNIRDNDRDIKNAKTARGITDGARYKSYSEEEKAVISESIKAYSKYAKHIYISEGIGNIGVEKIVFTVNRHIKYTGKKPVVIIDYLQILAPEDKRMNDKQNTDKAVLELKRLSRDKKIPVIAISSFNRASYNDKVGMTSFKESGSIEYSSDVLLGLQLKGAGEDNFDHLSAKDKECRDIELVVLKNRNGRVGTIVEFKYYTYFNYFNEAEPKTTL